MKLNFGMCRAGLVLAILAIASSASAYDWKNYPGSVCQPACNGNGAFCGYQPYDFLTSGGVEMTNRGSGILSVTCPILRDSVTETRGLADLAISVHGKVACWAYSTGFNDVIIDSYGPVSYNGTGFATLNFGSNLSSGVDYGSYNVYCNIYAGAAIGRVAYAEYDE
jgi:hypothetical protein